PGGSSDLITYGASGHSLQAICQQLNIPDGVAVNRIADMQGRRDPTLDFLSLESVRNPERYQHLAGQIEHSETTSAPLQQLLEGHIAYIDGSYARAACCYAHCIQVTPDNLDVWRDFAFALRHLGLKSETNAFLFHPQL